MLLQASIVGDKKIRYKFLLPLAGTSFWLSLDVFTYYFKFFFI